MPNHAVLLAVCAAVACTTSTAIAQSSPANPPRPAYDNLRFREDWSAAPTGDLFDPLKHLRLSDGGSVWLSLGGHLRARGELVRNYLAGGAGTRNDEFAVARAHLHADLRVGSHVRLFVEGRHGDVNGRELPGGARLIDRNTFDWGNAFAELHGTVAGRTTALRVGRQEFSLGRERIVSPLDWVNIRRVFQGVTVDSRRGAFTVGLFAAHPLSVLRTTSDVPDTHTLFWGSTVAWQRPKSTRIVEGALLVKDVDAAGTRPFTQRATATARLVTPVATDLSLELEGGSQRVRGVGGASYATMLVGELTWSRKGRWAPAISIGADCASGTGEGKPLQSGTWDQLYPLAHAFAGFADVLGRRNLLEERLVVQASATSTVRVRLAAHNFQRASSADGVYDVAGGELRASTIGAASGIGAEFDATAQWRIGRHLRMDGGAARFAPGQFMRDTGATRPYTWAYTSLTTTF